MTTKDLVENNFPSVEDFGGYREYTFVIKNVRFILCYNYDRAGFPAPEFGDYSIYITVEDPNSLKFNNILHQINHMDF